MHTAPALPELQRQFLAALYDADSPGPLAAIVGNGLAPEARLRIYRRSCSAIQAGALRASYPALLALTGEAWFEQTAQGYRAAHPSRAGNLQRFGDRLADYLETLPAVRDLPYLPDVARLEWLRQETALAAEAVPLAPDDFVAQLAATGAALRVVPHPSLRLLASRHAVLTLWCYAMQPAGERLDLPDEGECVALWNTDGDVAMAALDAASHACTAALAHGRPIGAARDAALAIDPSFDDSACIGSLLDHGLLVAAEPAITPNEEPSPCP